jgi:pimeloyl-ACP methyl ester carboxylesterase
MAERFAIAIAQTEIDDLRRRLQTARWPGDLANETWHYGTNERYLRELVEHWATSYDWRAHEQEMNQYPHYRAVIDGQPIHYLRTGRQGTLPLLLLGGWPWTFWDFRDVIPKLASDFDVVVAELPGYGFSSPLAKPKLGFVATADLLHQLMTGVLGFTRYGVYGADWGALVAEQLAYKYAGTVVGLHTSMPFPLDFAPIPQELWAPEEQPYAQLTAQWWQYGTAYFQMHATKPQTVAYLTDSPVAMAAWIVEKFHGWSDHRGNVEEAYPRERMLTTLSIYWFTNSLGSSARFYAESLQNPWQPTREGKPVITVPTGVVAFPKEVAQVPRRWVEEYFTLTRYTRADRGGHFPAVENPEVLAQEIRMFFSSLSL